MSVVRKVWGESGEGTKKECRYLDTTARWAGLTVVRLVTAPVPGFATRTTSPDARCVAAAPAALSALLLPEPEPGAATLRTCGRRRMMRAILVSVLVDFIQRWKNVLPR